MKMKIISLTLLLLFAIGCIPSVQNNQQLTTTEIMNSWTGSHISKVIRQWGPATQVTTDGQADASISGNPNLYLCQRYLRLLINPI